MSDKFPIGLVIGLVTQGAAIVWTVSMMMSDIESNREKIIETQQRIGRLEDSSQSQAIAIGPNRRKYKSHQRSRREDGYRLISTKGVWVHGRSIYCSGGC